MNVRKILRVTYCLIALITFINMGVSASPSSPIEGGKYMAIGKFYDNDKLKFFVPFDNVKKKKMEISGLYIAAWVKNGCIVEGSDGAIYDKDGLRFKGTFGKDKDGDVYVLKGEGPLNYRIKDLNNYYLDRYGLSSNYKKPDVFLKGSIALEKLSDTELSGSQASKKDLSKFRYYKLNVIQPFDSLSTVYGPSEDLDYNHFRVEWQKWNNKGKEMYFVKYTILCPENPLLKKYPDIQIIANTPFDKDFEDSTPYGLLSNGDQIVWESNLPYIFDSSSLIGGVVGGFAYNGYYLFKNGDYFKDDIIVFYPYSILSNLEQNDPEFTVADLIIRTKDKKIYEGNGLRPFIDTWKRLTPSRQSEIKNVSELLEIYEVQKRKKEEEVANREARKKELLARARDMMFQRHGKEKFEQAIVSGITPGMSEDLVDDYIKIVTFIFATAFESVSDDIGGSARFTDEMDKYSINHHYNLNHQTTTTKKYYRKNGSSIYGIPRIIIFKNGKVTEVIK